MNLNSELKNDWLIKVQRDVPTDLWDALLAHATTASPFQSQSWVEAWSASYGTRPLYITAFDVRGSLLAGLIALEIHSYKGILREYQALPWGAYGSIIVRDGAPSDCGQAILLHFLQLLRGHNCRAGTVVDFAGNCSMLSKTATSICESFAQVLRLGRPLEDIHSDYDYSIKKNLKKAERSSIYVRECNCAADIEAYCNLSDYVARKYGQSSYSHDFFRNVYRITVPRGGARFTLAFHNERPIAGTLHLTNSKHVFNWLTVSNPEFLGLRPVEAIIAATIDWAAKKGCQIYNFGGSPRDAAGVIRFKEKWGALRTIYSEYRFQGHSRAAQIERFLNKVSRLRRKVLLR